MRVLFAILAFAAVAPATTLRQLSTDDMIRQSTAIVRAKVTGASASFRGRDIFTSYQFQVLETLKSGPQPLAQVAVPGGAAGNIRQMVAGAPSLTIGQEYVIFLWTGKSGLTQVIGLSQGLYSVMQDASGNAVLVRPAAGAVVLNKTGNVVSDSSVSMTLAALRSEIANVLGAGQ